MERKLSYHIIIFVLFLIDPVRWSVGTPWHTYMFHDVPWASASGSADEPKASRDSGSNTNGLKLGAPGVRS